MNSEIKKPEEKHLQLILDGLPAMIGHWRHDLKNLNANKAYLDYFGKLPEEIKGKHIKEILGEEIFNKNFKYIEKVLQGENQTFERELPHKDGGTRHTLASYIPVIENNKVMSFLVIVTDITEIKKMELQRRHFEAQLTESTRLATLGEMAGGIAHEINSPLAIIQGKASLMLNRIESSKWDKTTFIKDLKIIENTVERIAKIIIGLRTYARDEKNDPLESTDVKTVIENTIALCSERFRNKSIKLTFTQNEILTIDARSAQISQVIMNLLSNSFDAVTELEEKWVKIQAFSEGEKVKIIISDSGHGIPESVVKKMMQPFFTTKEIGKGTGLGLSISKGIMEMHGGSISYDSKSKNTTFILEIKSR